MPEHRISHNTEDWIVSLRGVKAVLDSAGIRYWLDTGTLLGAIRDQKFIGWDDDIDLSADISEVPKVLALVDQFAALGYRVDVTDSSIYLSGGIGQPKIGFSFYRTSGDRAWVMFLVKPTRWDRLLRHLRRVANKISYASYQRNLPQWEERLYRLIPRAWHWRVRRFLFGICDLMGEKNFAIVMPHHLVANLVPHRFYDLEFLVPHPAEEYLAIMYGQDWRVPRLDWKWEDTQSIQYDFKPFRRRNDYSLFHTNHQTMQPVLQASISSQANRRIWVKAFLEIKDWLDAAGVTYWLSMGTALGAVREGRFISHDGDIDFGILMTEAPKLLRLLPGLGRRGWRVDVTTFSLFISQPGTDVIIEIMVYAQRDDQLWTPLFKTPPRFNRLLKYADLLAERAIYRDYHQNIPRHYAMAYALIPRSLDRGIRDFLFRLNDKFGQRHQAMAMPKSLVESLASIQLYGVSCPVPHPVADYLERIYGSDWRTPNSNWSVADVKSLDKKLFRTRDQVHYSLM